MKQVTVVTIVVCCAVIVVGTVTLAASKGYFADIFQPAAVFSSADSPLPPAEIADNPFALGEYYFNQPPYDSGEVYDLAKASHYYMQSVLQAIQSGEPVPEYAWYQLARVDFVEGKLDGAISKLQRQLAVHGESVPQTHYMLGLAYGYKALETDAPEDWQAAEAAFEHFVEYVPKASWPRVDLAWVYFSQGKFQEMLPVLETGLVYEGDHAWLLNTYGLALLNTGDSKGAREAFEQALSAYQRLSVENWQQAYSGNDPMSWNRNFGLFGDTIAYNLSLVD